MDPKPPPPGLQKGHCANAFRTFLASFSRVKFQMPPKGLQGPKMSAKMLPRLLGNCSVHSQKRFENKAPIFGRFWEPPGLPVITFLAIQGPFWVPSGPPEIRKLNRMLAETRISKNPLQIRRESTENRQEPAKNPPRTRRTNSKQKQFPERVSMKDSLIRQTLQQKCLESKWGGGAPPWGASIK